MKAMFTFQLLIRQLVINSSQHATSEHVQVFTEGELLPRHGRRISCHSEGNNFGPSVACHLLTAFLQPLQWKL